MLSVILGATVDLLRPEYNPCRNLLDDALVGPLSFFMRAAACALAATFLIVLVGLRLNIRRSGFLMVSCVLIGFVVISLCASAVWPIDVLPSDGRHSILRAVISLFSTARFYAVLIALLVTLPMAIRRNEEWRALSLVTLFLGFLTLAFQVWFFLAPVSLIGLVDRGSGLPILVWLFLVGMRLRRVIPSTHGTAA